VERIAIADMPTKYGPFAAYGYRSVTDGQKHVALVCGYDRGAYYPRPHFFHFVDTIAETIRSAPGCAIPAAITRPKTAPL